VALVANKSDHDFVLQDGISTQYLFPKALPTGEPGLGEVPDEVLDRHLAEPDGAVKAWFGPGGGLERVAGGKKAPPAPAPEPAPPAPPAGDEVVAPAKKAEPKGSGRK
jgi:hypothetical protein